MRRSLNIRLGIHQPSFASNYIVANRNFLLTVCFLLGISLVFYQQPHIAMWIGFAIAGYSAIADDSIQTIGTFLSSNKHRSWWVLWLYIGSIMAVVLLWGWSQGDVSYGRLERIPEPQSFLYLQLAAPVILLIMTRLAMPVSTTFLLLSTFSDSKTIEGMVAKSLIGYGVAFVASIVLWTAVSWFMNQRKVETKNENEKYWYAFQWMSTGVLWAVWLMQDAANVVVYLPRALNFGQISIIIVFLLGVLAFIFRRGGGNIQKVVETKTDVKDVRSASIIDFFYAAILFVFKGISNLPMSTTWVFLGLLAGREIAIAYNKSSKDNMSSKTRYEKVVSVISMDLIRAAIGMGISIALALAINS